MVRLILGGAASGKSQYAEKLVLDSQKKRIYIATAQAHDEGMRQKIVKHQQRRTTDNWLAIEEPIALAAVLEANADVNTCILVDCLTLWLSNILFDRQGNLQESLFKQQVTALLTCIKTLNSDVIFVSNDVSGGIIPMDAMSRRFVDEAGLLHQQLAQRCDHVVLVTAGLSQVLK